MEYPIAALYRALRTCLSAPGAGWANRAYAALAPAGTSMPYLVYTAAAAEPLDGGMNRWAVTVRLIVTAASAGEALEAAGEAADRLDGAESLLDAGESWTVLACLRVGAAEKVSRVDGSALYESTLVYRVILAPDQPSYPFSRPVSFGGVALPSTLIRWSDNFARLTPEETAVPGMDGAFYEGGSAPPGRVEITYRAGDTSPAARLTTRDVLRGLIGLGEADLVIEPAPGAAERFTRARLVDVETPEIPAEAALSRGEITLTFAAPTPRWFSLDSPAGSGAISMCSGASSDLIRASGGSMPAYPLVTLTAISTLGGVTIQRIVGGAVADQVSYSASISPGGVLVIDPRRWQVTLNGVDAYTTAFSAAHPAWFRLLPGQNTVRVLLDGGGTANLSLAWRDTWL